MRGKLRSPGVRAHCIRAPFGEFTYFLSAQVLYSCIAIVDFNSCYYN